MIKFPWPQPLLPGYGWPPQAKAGGKNTSFLGAHLLSCCCSHNQRTFLCSGEQELCARHFPHLRGPGGRGSQARQLPLSRQELTEKAGSLLSNSEFLSQARGEDSLPWEQGKSVLGGKFLLRGSPGEEGGGYGNGQAVWDCRTAACSVMGQGPVE